MRDIRLEELPFEFNGKTYLLRCNMNVLADVQEASGGTIGGVLSGSNPTKAVLLFLAAMLNDYADEQGWPETFTARDVGRKLGPNMLSAAEIMGLVTRSIAPPSSDVSTPDTEGSSSGDEENLPENSGN